METSYTTLVSGFFSSNILFDRFVYGIGGKKSSSQSAYILSGLQLKRVRQISTYPRALAARTSVPVPGSQEYHEINNSSADIRDVRICMYMFQPSLLVGWLLVAYFMLIPRNSQWTWFYSPWWLAHKCIYRMLFLPSLISQCFPEYVLEKPFK